MPQVVDEMIAILFSATELTNPLSHCEVKYFQAAIGAKLLLLT